MTDEKLQEKYRNQADMLANRVKKQFKHFRKRFAKLNIEVFRLYDWDIPEIRAVVDWYAGHLVIAEYMRRQSTPDWLPMMGKAVGDSLSVRPDKVHLKQRRVGFQDGNRYERIDETDKKIIMHERDLKFYINLDDYVDTGLFADHRNTRQMVRDMAADKDFLNLYCYTGSFSCYAAKGGSKSIVSVDRSETAVNWTKENLELNGLTGPENKTVQSATFDYLEKAKSQNQKFDLAIVDPPSYSTSRNKKDDFDILKDHPKLLIAVIKIMRKGAIVLFSTNHQDFTPQMDGLAVTDIKEITSKTIPVDYVNKKKNIHRCWKIVV